MRRFLVALKKRNPEHRVEVESGDDPDENVPPLPYGRLRVWEN